MKTAPPPLNRRGIALVIVLSFIALLSVLVLAFLGSVSTELGSSSSFAASSDVKQRAQTAVNLVIGQIQAATSQSDIAWASQPGMIRTYDKSGNDDHQYKLYSSDVMVETNFDPLSGGKPSDIDADWAGKKAEWTDLNEPVLVPSPTGTIQPDPASNKKFIAQYPILDPAALDSQVKGFSAKSISGGSVSAPAGGENPLTAGNRLPMPVRWLYMLKNGELKALSGGSIPGATKENPPVARIAFWSDDESAKININTAGGDDWNNTSDPGSFTDQPAFSHSFEGKLKANQPVNHEYQRYPGHPATTYLSAALPGLTREQIYGITPRVTNLLGSTDVSSSGGTKKTNLDDVYNSAKPKSLPLSKALPLYSSVDELRFKRSTSARGTEPLLTTGQVEQAKFFLTAQSRAPEVTIFNTPRVSMWPQLSDPLLRTGYDKTIAFASTVAGVPYYFVRKDARSPTADWTDQPTNRALYNYLSSVTGKEITGMGGQFDTKYGSDHPQILTEMMDYIRSCINLLDPINTNTFTKPKPWDTAQIKNLTGGPGHVVPLYIESNDTMGFGRSSTLYSPIIVFYAMETRVDPALPDGQTRTGGAAQSSLLYTKSIQAAMLFDTFAPAHGLVRFIPDLVFELTDVSGFQLDGSSLNFSPGTAIYNKYANHEYAVGSYSTGANLVASAPTKEQYPFFSGTVNVNKQFREPILFSGGQAKLTIYARLSDGTKGDKIQTIDLDFPSASIPTPAVQNCIQKDYSLGLVVRNGTATNYFSRHMSSEVVGHTASNPNWQGGPTSNIAFNFLYDATRSLVPSHGDMRLVAARRNVPSTVFVKARRYNADVSTNYQFYNVDMVNPDKPDKYGDSGGMVAGRSIVNNAGGPKDTVTGSLVNGARYDIHLAAGDYNRGPAVADLIGFGADQTKPYILDASDVPSYPGDWDNGMGSWPDGPYINKADEGEVGPEAYTSWNQAMNLSTLFSPNRQVPSPVIMGSLSTGVKRNKPWQTLLFCANPAAKSNHPGFGSGVGGTGPQARPPYVTPPDHLLLDLFSMPVVEPYAISEPFSTAGKVNMNYQIVPFTNIERSTALQAVLRSTRVTAIPTTNGYNDTNPATKWGYKTAGNAAQGDYRRNVNIEETLKGFQARFDDNELFRTASQICDLFLVPDGALLSSMPGWWDSYMLTGDNQRERPYSQIYSRLTTKSNTYTVHVRVQSLQQLKRNSGGSYGTWEEGKDKVTGEYRASYIIERYLNPNQKTHSVGQALTDYKFRTVSTKQFTP
jgi:uncharacterized protein (TIGR02600 family)